MSCTLPSTLTSGISPSERWSLSSSETTVVVVGLFVWALACVAVADLCVESVQAHFEAVTD